MHALLIWSGYARTDLSLWENKTVSCLTNLKESKTPVKVKSVHPFPFLEFFALNSEVSSGFLRSESGLMDLITKFIICSICDDVMGKSSFDYDGIPLSRSHGNKV